MPNNDSTIAEGTPGAEEREQLPDNVVRIPVDY